MKIAERQIIDTITVRSSSTSVKEVNLQTLSRSSHGRKMD